MGDNFDDVNNATGGTASGLTTYTPDQLELAKTYYWRVDEFDSDAPKQAVPVPTIRPVILLRHTG